VAPNGTKTGFSSRASVLQYNYFSIIIPFSSPS